MPNLAECCTGIHKSGKGRFAYILNYSLHFKFGYEKASKDPGLKKRKLVFLNPLRSLGLLLSPVLLISVSASMCALCLSTVLTIETGYCWWNLTDY